MNEDISLITQNRINNLEETFSNIDTNIDTLNINVSNVNTNLNNQVTIINNSLTDIDSNINELRTLINTINNILTNSDYVVEYKLATTDSPSWYRLYKSGWLEQGNEITTPTSAVSTAGNLTITFVKPFKDTSYHFDINGQVSSAITGSNTARIFKFGYKTKTTTNIVGNCAYISSGGEDYRAGKASWYACGQSA